MLNQNQFESDPAVWVPNVYFSPGPEYADANRSFQGIPGIERSRNGRLWVTWYGGGPEESADNYVLLATSNDDGRTWSAPTLVIDPSDKVRAFDPTLWHDPLGRLWLFWAQSYDVWDGRGGVWAMVADNPDAETPAWSRPRRLADGIMLNKPLALSNGEWVLPAMVWDMPAKKSIPEKYKHAPAKPPNVDVVVSGDRGNTWSVRGGAHIPIPNRTSPFMFALEHMVIERKDQSLWMLVRTPYGIGESVSNDHGRSWSEGQPSTIPHVNSRFFICRLRSGRLLLVRHDSPGIERKDFPMGTRNNLKAFLSDDDGRTWQGGLLLDERDQISYPDAVEAPDGTIYVIYDFQRSRAKEILLAVFTEEDIIRGKCTSAACRMKALVSKATGPEYSDAELQAINQNLLE